jgi:hypothetical protein
MREVHVEEVAPAIFGCSARAASEAPEIVECGDARENLFGEREC